MNKRVEVLKTLSPSDFEFSAPATEVGEVVAGPQECPEDEVRRWLLQTHHGVLGTVNVGRKMGGWPFLSVVPFAVDAFGCPLLQLADIAQHTRNAKADSRASLLIQQPMVQGDVQSGWRVTVLGTLERVADPAVEEALARFVQRVPQALDYSKQHDFNLYRLKMDQIRFIGGFGRISWVDVAKVMGNPQRAAEVLRADEAIAHMNGDHRSSMLDLCEGLYGFRPVDAEMTSLEAAGFFVRTQGPERLVYFSFDKEVTASSLRVEMISLLSRARSLRTGAQR